MTTYNIVDFGAVDDGVTVCTNAIQRAIDLCDAGDMVLIPAGRFISGALFVKSNMTLYLEEGAYLMASGDIRHFPLMGYPFEGTDQICYASLINTDGAPHENITIDGHGTIDAAGSVLYRAELDEARGKRGRAVCLRNTKGVTIRGVTIRHSPAWCLHLLYCRQVMVEGVSIFTKHDEAGNRYRLHNGDGMDIDSCRDVTVRNCHIASQDDCIAIKSGRNAEGRRAGIPSRDIVIENCTFGSGFGVAIGSEMSGGVENVTVKNCEFRNTFSIASIKAIRGRGGYVRNIRFEDCTHFNHSTEYGDTRWFRGAIYADGFYGDEEFDPDTPKPLSEETPTVEDIFFKNITTETIAGNAVYLCGLPERPFRRITLENVRAHGKFGVKSKNIEGLLLIQTFITP